VIIRFARLFSGSRYFRRRFSDETVDDIEIRTDIDVDDPVLSKSLYGRRVGRGEKQKFITGLKARNEDVYSGEGTSGMRRGSSSLLNPVTGEVKGSSPDYETHFGSDAHVYRQDVVNELRQKYQDGISLKKVTKKVRKPDYHKEKRELVLILLQVKEELVEGVLDKQ
jgi:hypothetical protein